MRLLGALLAALAVASCAFGSERALFSDEDAVVPFTDGAIYTWTPNSEPDEAMTVRFVRIGDRYELRRIDRTEERPMHVLFTSVRETHQDDYIAQIVLDSEGEDGFVYAFLWPLGDDRYRVFFQPSGFNESGEQPSPAGYCTPAPYNGCTFTSAENVRAYFLNVLYPAFANGHRPARYLTLTPAPQGKR
jgi:hypothetical protein